MSTSIELYVAFSSAVVSILGSVMAWLQATRVARMTTSAALQAEQIRAGAVLRSKLADLKISDAGEVANALSAFWEKLQQVKELITKLSNDDDYPRELVLGKATEISDDISRGYAKWGGMLSPRSRDAWHIAKNVVAGFVHNEATSLPRSREDLMAMKFDLTEIQLLISEERYVCYTLALRDLEFRS